MDADQRRRDHLALAGGVTDCALSRHATNRPFETRFGHLPSELPEYNAVDPESGWSGEPDPDLAWERLESQPEMVEFFSRLYGDYPFSSVGAIVDHRGTSPAPRSCSTRRSTTGGR